MLCGLRTFMSGPHGRGRAFPFHSLSHPSPVFPTLPTITSDVARRRQLKTPPQFLSGADDCEDLGISSPRVADGVLGGAFDKGKTTYNFGVDIQGRYYLSTGFPKTFHRTSVCVHLPSFSLSAVFPKLLFHAKLTPVPLSGIGQAQSE